PNEKWINFYARNAQDPVKLVYLFHMAEAMFQADSMLEHLLHDAMPEQGINSVIEMSCEDEGVSKLNSYLAGALVRIEYTWSEEELLSGREGFYCKADIHLSSQDLYEKIGLVLLATVYYGGEGDLVVEIN